MAMIVCKECKAQVSDTAKTCPQCGAKVTKKTSVFTWIVGFIFIGTLFTFLNKGDSMKQAAAARQAHKPAPSWQYQSGKDEMTGKPIKVAVLASTNSLSLEFPYAGSNFGQIDVQKKVGKSDTVLLSIEKGQTLCKSYAADCRVMVKFDDAQPLSFSGQSPSDGSPNFVFVQPASKFIAESKKAKRIKVSIDLFHNGTQILDFNTANALSW